MDHDGVGGGGEVGFPPHALVEVLHGEDLSPVLYQQAQDAPLRIRQVQLPVVAPDHVAGEADPQAAPLRLLLDRLRLAPVDLVPPQQALHPGQQLRVGEGLHQVVVPAAGVAHGQIRLLALGGEEQHRHVPLFPQPQAHVVAGDPLHHDVQDHQVHILGVVFQILQGLLAAGGLRYLEALPRQQDAQHVPDLPVVVHNQNFIPHTASPTLMSSGPFALLLKQTQEEGRRFLVFLFLLRDVSALYQTGFRLVIFSPERGPEFSKKSA